MTLIKYVVGAALCLVPLLIQEYRYRTLEAEHSHLIDKCTQLEKQTELANRNAELMEQLNAEHTQFKELITEYRKANNAALKKLLQNDAASANWASMPIPDGFRRLHKTESENRASGRAHVVPAPNAVPNTERGKQH